MTIPCLARRETNKERGRHLLANEFIEKGRLIFCERPIVALQSTGNIHAGVLVCQYCYAFVGTPQQALQVAADPSILPQIVTVDTNTSTSNSTNHTSTPLEHALIPCPYNCGHVYCSKECQQDDWHWGGHKELCTGIVTDPQHPIIQFKQHAVQSNEIFLLIAKWLARIIKHDISYPFSHMDHHSSRGGCTVCDVATSTNNNNNNNTTCHPLIDFTMEPWWDVATLPLRNNPAALAELITISKSCHRLCQESHTLLQKAWSEFTFAPEQHQHQQEQESSPVAAAWLKSPIAMARLIGSLEQNCMGIRRKHPVRYVIMEDASFRQEFHAQLIQCLEKAGMIGDDDEEEEEEEGDEEDDNNDEADDTELKEEDCGEDCNNDNCGANLVSGNTNSLSETNNNASDAVVNSSNQGDDHQWDYTPDEIADFLANLDNPLNIGSDDEWDAICLPLDGTAHFALAEKMNHSCEPNVVLLYKSRGWGRDHPLVAYCVALRDIQPNEELTLCYIDADEPYQSRQQALANYGFQCTCPKCQREKNETTNSGPEENNTPYSDENDNDVGVDDDDKDIDDGDGSTSKETDNELLGDQAELSGDAKLQNVVEQLESTLNKSIHAPIPLQYLEPASAYILQLADTLVLPAYPVLHDTDNNNNNNNNNNNPPLNNLVPHLLDRCCNGIRERDFSLCRLVGSDLESVLCKATLRTGSFSESSHREAYWCACSTAAIGYSHEGSFLVAMKYLDKALMFGLQRQKLEDFFSYVEVHASQMALTPCPHALECQVPNYQLPELKEILSNAIAGLDRHPSPASVKELNCSSSQFEHSVLMASSEPIVIPGLAQDWPAIQKWCNISTLSRYYGHRLVPIQALESWSSSSSTSGQLEHTMNKETLMDFRSFSSTYLTPSTKELCWSLQDTTLEAPAIPVAQIAPSHQLLEQIPDLYQDLKKLPCEDGTEPIGVNAHISTGGLHTSFQVGETCSNFLVQLVGAQYIRLYAANDRINHDFDAENAEDFPYSRVLLLPGDALYIPSGYWCHVQTLSTNITLNYKFLQ